MSRNPQGRGRGRGGRNPSLPFHPRGGSGGPPPQHAYSTEGQSQYGRGGRGGWGGGGEGGGRSRGGRGGLGRGRGGPVQVDVFQSESGVPSPDTTVKNIENEYETSWMLAREKSVSQKTEVDLKFRLPQRPGFGTKGRAVVLWTNYFNMMSYGDMPLYRYSMEILEKQGRRSPTGKKLKRVVQLFLEEHLAHYGHDIVTDFKSNLLSKSELDLKELEYTVAYRAEDEDDPAPSAKVYRLQLQPTGTITVSNLMDYLTPADVGQLLSSKEETIQALNMIVGHHSKEAPYIASIGSNRHFRLDGASTEKFNLGEGLTALRGFFISVRAATARILINVQVKHGAFYNDGPLDTLMLDFMSHNGQNKIKLGNFVKRLSVDVTHIVKRNKSGRRIPRIKLIMSLATRDDGQGQVRPPIVSEFGAGSKDVKFFLDAPSPKPSGNSQSSSGTSDKKGRRVAADRPGPSSTGEYISVYDYFKRVYPTMIIKDTRLPVVNVGTRQNPSYLPPDVCTVLPGQPAKSKLTASQTQQMIRYAVRKPTENAKSIANAGVRMLGLDSNNSTLESFGTRVLPTLITVPGRVLAGPEVKYHGNKAASIRFGSWNMENIQLATGANLPNWTYLWISAEGSRDPWRNPAELKYTLDSFTEALTNVGIIAAPANWNSGKRIMVNHTNLGTRIDDAIHLLSSPSGGKPLKLILVILPSNDAAIYNRVKYACDVKEGILNVCVVAQKFGKANSQYHANVALKVNLKLGGQNQFLHPSKLNILAEGKTMVVGIDVTHPAPGSSSNAPSVASIVASVDQWLAQWPAELRIQTGRKEMVSDLGGLCRSRLILWKAKHGVYPENILIYRDGVSEGQYNLVLDEELPALRKACKELYPATSTKQGFPRMTIIIVGKRHNTRFYPTKAEDADRSSNPKNGTVVDRGVTEARNWDFFLQSHTAIQGTARPAHYYIIHDEIFQAREVPPPFENTADVVEDLTHNLCYLFGRATKAVSICPPAYYADLACERARCYLSGLLDGSSSAASTSNMGSGQTNPSGQTADPSLVRIHNNVKDSMFYI